MKEYVRPAFVMLVLFTALTGLIYPLAMTGIAQVVAPAPANGSLAVSKGALIGSKLIGQAFTSDKYFHSRPSAAGDGYNAAASSGSNLGPTSQKLLDRAKASTDALGMPLPVPADAVTASGSGLDPHISPQFAQMQVKRVAAARAVNEQRIQEILSRISEAPALGFIGEPRVNVLELNMTLDADLAASGG